MPDAVDEGIRMLVAKATGIAPDTIEGLPDDTPLLSGRIGISSQAGARLLLAVKDHFGVDVAHEDLALVSLESIGSLVNFVRERLPERP